MRRGGAFIKCLESSYEGCIHRVLKLAVRCIEPQLERSCVWAA